MPFLYILIGVCAGIFGGLFGIGGATVIVPILVMFFGFSQHNAQGTTLAAMVPPIGLLAAWRYYSQGHVHIPTAAYIAFGFFLGGYIGACFSFQIPDIMLKKLFGVFLLIIALRFIFVK